MTTLIDRLSKLDWPDREDVNGMDQILERQSKLNVLRPSRNFLRPVGIAILRAKEASKL